MSAKKILLSLTLMIWFYNPLQAQVQDTMTDSAVYIKKKIKENYKALQRKKARQIKRIETKDSAIIYGADKARTHIVHILYWKKSDKKNLQFNYDENGVISIIVLKPTTKVNGVKHKGRNSVYHFANGKLFHSNNGHTEDDIGFLLGEANRLLRQGTLLLEHP